MCFEVVLVFCVVLYGFTSITVSIVVFYIELHVLINIRIKVGSRGFSKGMVLY